MGGFTKAEGERIDRERDVRMVIKKALRKAKRENVDNAYDQALLIQVEIEKAGFNVIHKRS